MPWTKCSQGDRVSEMRWTFDNVKLFWEPYESPDTKELLIKVRPFEYSQTKN